MKLNQLSLTYLITTTVRINLMFEYSMFHQLPPRVQAEVLTRQGTLLAQRQHKQWTVTLYVLNNYFIERWSGNGLEVSASFKKSARPLTILEPYLDNLDIREALES